MAAIRKYLSQVGIASVEEAFNGLRTITRNYDVNGEGLPVDKIKDEVFLSYGTADEEFKSALLIKRGMQPVSGEKNAFVQRLTEVYQEFADGQKTSVGEDVIQKLDDGRTALVRRYVVLTKDAETLTPAVGTILDTRALQTAQINKQGVGAEIVETYISAGILAQSTDYSNNGLLEIRSITYFNGTPTTPAGFTLVNTSEQNPNGLPGRTYRFALGTGEISRRTDHGQCGSTVDGTIGVTTLNIDYLTVPGSAEPTWASVSGFVKITVTKRQQDGYMVWSAVFAKGVGLVSENIDYGPAGLRRVTDVSLGTKVTPTGIVIADDYRLADGYTIFTVTTMQTDTGGADPTAASVSAERYVNFDYPGRIKAYTETTSSKTYLQTYESPPVTAKVKATVTISYVTSNTLGTISDLWNPTDWATIRAQWTGSYGRYSSFIEAKRGYRSVSATPVTLAGSGYDAAIFGRNIYNGTTASITVEGGPSNPDGQTYTLDADIDPNPVFTTTAGVRYYRKTVIVATIPAQAALPV